MRSTANILLCICIELVCSCSKNNTEPNYSPIPYIEPRNLQFNKGNLNGSFPNPDTLKLTLYLRDGDFDLGLNYAEDTLAPYNYLYVFNKTEGKLVAVTTFPKSLKDLVVYKDRKTFDTLPLLTCSRWQLFHGMNGTVLDTLYAIANPNFTNLNTQLYYSVGTQDWQLFDFNNAFGFPDCASSNPFNLRFPRLSQGIQTLGKFFSYRSSSPHEGIMTFSVISHSLQPLFAGKKIKLRFSIRDRALNQSNTVETQEIQF